jgi:hypothetical protein
MSPVLNKLTIDIGCHRIPDIYKISIIPQLECPKLLLQLGILLELFRSQDAVDYLGHLRWRMLDTCFDGVAVTRKVLEAAKLPAELTAVDTELALGGWR